MASGMYDSGREACLAGDIAADTDNLKASLIDAADYTRDLATHDFYDDVPAAAEVADSANLAGKTITAGVFDANDVVWSSVSGDQSEQIIVRKDTGVDSTSQMLINIDTATGLPVTPNGGDITVQWDSGANKIFKL